MKRTILLLIAAMALLMLASCASVDPLRLVASPDKDAQIYIQGSSTFAAKNTKDIQMIVGPDSFDGRTAGFIVSIADTNKGTFQFRDDSIELYGGNKDKDSWKLIGKWDSAAYFKENRRQARVALAATGIIGAIAIIDAILNPDDAPDIFLEIATDALIIQSDIAEIESSIYVSGDASVMTAIAAIEAGIAIDQLSEMYDAEAKDQVIQVPAKSNVSSVSGKVVFRNLPKYPDYKIVFANGRKDMDFVFSRTDREEIINPWKDRSSATFAVNYSYTYGLDRHSITLNFLEPKYIGMFTGVGLRPMADDLYVGLSLGMNCKISDYSWISGGIEIGDIASDSDDVNLLGTLGINICANMLSFYGGAVYDNGQLYGELGAGIAF